MLSQPCSIKVNTTAYVFNVGAKRIRKKSRRHIDVPHSGQPLMKGERLLRYEVNTVMITMPWAQYHG